MLHGGQDRQPKRNNTHTRSYFWLELKFNFKIMVNIRVAIVLTVFVGRFSPPNSVRTMADLVGVSLQLKAQENICER